MISKLFQAQIAKRKNFHRRRMHDEDKDITYINERNRKFNEKIDRSYSKVLLHDSRIVPDPAFLVHTRDQAKLGAWNCHLNHLSPFPSFNKLSDSFPICFNHQKLTRRPCLTSTALEWALRRTKRSVSSLSKWCSTCQITNER